MLAIMRQVQSLLVELGRRNHLNRLRSELEMEGEAVAAELIDQIVATVHAACSEPVVWLVVRLEPHEADAVMAVCGTLERAQELATRFLDARMQQPGWEMVSYQVETRTVQ